MCKKKGTVLFAVWIVSVIFLCLTAEGVDAFCVYNNTDIEFTARENQGGKSLKEFEKQIRPGGHACCNWKNRDCNAQGKRDSIITLSAAIMEVDIIYICFKYPVRAGGWLSVTGEKDSYLCKSYFDESWDKDGDDQ
ncbi:MAG: hypothetical protein AB2L22_02410 [Syntrophales bacterium]